MVAVPEKAHETYVVGLMSGTSCDGLDIALVRFDGEATLQPDPGELVRHTGVPYPQDLSHALRAVSGLADPEELHSLPAGIFKQLADFWLASVQAFCAGHDMPPVALLCSHGHTLLHRPDLGMTTQWDCPEQWVRSLGCAVVTDVRRQDMDAGGQGAPLAPLLHMALYTKSDAPVAVLNLGGMANVTVLPAGAGAGPVWWAGVRGWDTGPGNVLLDAFVQTRTCGEMAYDADGALALAGKPDHALIRAWMQHPWFRQASPRSTGRDAFGPGWLAEKTGQLQGLSDADGAATLAEFTVQCVVESLRANHEPVTEGMPLVVAGGGRWNAYMLQSLARCGFDVEPADHADAVEAWLMALIGYRTFCGIPSGMPDVTGARESCILGTLLNQID